MGATLLPDIGTEILIPLCAFIGIAFSVVQWMYVSQVKLSPGRDANSNAPGKNGYNDYLIEEEEGGNDHNVVLKCAEIQNAISEGPFFLSCILRLSLALVDPTSFVFSIWLCDFWFIYVCVLLCAYVFNYFIFDDIILGSS